MLLELTRLINYINLISKKNIFLLRIIIMIQCILIKNMFTKNEINCNYKTKDIYYFSSPGGYEVDFYLPKKQQLIQVTQNLDHPAVREREFRALQDAIGSVKVQSALILADTDEKTIEINGVPVEIQSAAKWLMNE